MPRLSFYLLALATTASMAFAEDKINWKGYRLRGVSEAYYCPEQVGEEKWECDNKYCGGEHPKKKDHCSLVILQGKSEGFEPVNQWVMNKPLYCKCGPKSGDGITVPPIIPFPPPPPGFVPPPAGLPHPKNKDSCPEDFTETKCDDCKPKSGWCTEGPQAGCPCRDKCPADDSDDAPSCNSESCQGEDGKCTTGHYADCNCKDICPDNETEYIECQDDDCKSEDNETCKEGKYKGCKCLLGVTAIVNQNPKFQAAYQHMEKLTDVYNNIEKYVPEADAKCSSTDYSDAIAVDKSKLYELGDKFCSELDQKKKSSKDLKYNAFTFHFEYKPGNNCYTDCKETIRKMACSGYDAHSVQPESKATFKCGAEYSFKISKEGDDDDNKYKLDVKRTCVKPDELPKHGKIDSDKQAQYGVEFCKSLKGKKITPIMETIRKQTFDDKERVWYGYQVGWEGGGSCDESIDKIDAQFPLGKDHKNTCESLMRFVYKMCGDNDGSGGFYRVGCAKYSYIGFGSG